MTDRPSRAPRVLVIGAGFGGIAAAIELRRHGFDDVTILEAAPGTGGTWHHNTYPGAACDVPSPFYSFSYAQRTDWTHLCSPQPQILRYVREVATEFGVDKLITYDSEVTACRWDDARAEWDVETADGISRAADAVIVATGQLHRPVTPVLPGLEEFAGHAFHSARWDHDYDLGGKRVAVIGTGASAVQFVPEIAEQVAQLAVYQRTGNWFLARRNRRYPPGVRWAVAHVPGLQPFLRAFWFHYCELLTAAIRHPRTVGRIVKLRSTLFMRRQLKDHPELRAKVWPDYTFGCKRILFSSHFLPALARPNVEVVPDAITGLTAEGVRTADGTVRAADCIIWATGFATNDFMFPMEITGRGGRSLRDDWREGAHAHLGITVPGYPSLFVLYGPNTNTSGGSIIWYLEQQVAYVRQALDLVRSRGAAAIEVRAEVEAASDRALQKRFAGTAWTGCDSWYRDPRGAPPPGHPPKSAASDAGRIVANWPGYMREYGAAVRELDADEFTLVAR